MAETRTYGVSLASADPSAGRDDFYKYRGQELPEEGSVISVVRFLRSRPIRARVTRADVTRTPPIAATQID